MKILFWILVIFFTAVVYRVWQEDKPKYMKIGSTLLVLLILIAVGSGGNADNKSVEMSPSPVAQEEIKKEEKPEYSMEQKQTDFKKFYVDYTKRGGLLLLTKATIIKVSGSTGSREELYLSLDKIGTLLDNTASLDNALPIPDSLKEYKDMNSAVMYMQLTATAYKSAVGKFQTYLNKGDLKALKDAQANSDRGDQNLLTSSEAIEKVAKELGVDTSLIKVDE